MPRIKTLKPNQADSKTLATLESVEKKLGGLPNIFTTFARSPAALSGYVQLSELLAGGRLSARQRELIALAIAQENACGYCLSAHAAIGRKVGISAPDIEQARNGRASDTMDNLITAFALQVTRTRGEISDTDLEALRDQGLDDGLIVEVIANVSLNVMTNYLNKLAGTEIDFPVVDLRPAA